MIRSGAWQDSENSRRRKTNMAQTTPQNFENHVRIVPAYHFVASTLLAINLIWAIYKLVRDPSGETVIGLLLVAAVVIVWFYSRNFALTVQDRVVRLETTLRLEKLASTDLRAQIPQLTLDQLVALRFASDPELPELAIKVLNEKITTRTAIKKLVKNWNPDYLRA